MSVLSSALPPRVLDYPETDDHPIAENTIQYEWIVTIKGGLDGVFRDDPNAFVAGDLFWYPVEGRPDICTAPDIMVALGRPKGHRRSYLQWEEGNQPPQAVFEILSPGNRVGNMIRKHQFFERYGVQEYHVYDPDDEELTCMVRIGERLTPVANSNGWVSPLLGIKFDLSTGQLRISGPDGRPFVTFAELMAQRNEAEKHAAEAEKHAAEAEKHAAEAARLTVAVQATAEKLAAQLRALGITPEA